MPKAKIEYPPLIKFVKGALDTPLEKVDNPAGGVDANWQQVDLVSPPETNIVTVAGLAEHTDMSMFEHQFWYHQLALILEGEMLIQDLDKGDLYRAQKGDLFYWAPGLHVMIGGKFKAYYVKTPVPLRWFRSPDGKKNEVVTQWMENEIVMPGSPPVEKRTEKMQRAD